MELLLSKHCVQAFCETVSIDIVSLHKVLSPVYELDAIICMQNKFRECSLSLDMMYKQSRLAGQKRGPELSHSMFQ